MPPLNPDTWLDNDHKGDWDDGFQWSAQDPPSLLSNAVLDTSLVDPGGGFPNAPAGATTVGQLSITFHDGDPHTLDYSATLTVAAQNVVITAPAGFLYTVMVVGRTFTNITPPSHSMPGLGISMGLGM